MPDPKVWEDTGQGLKHLNRQNATSLIVNFLNQLVGTRQINDVFPGELHTSHSETQKMGIGNDLRHDTANFSSVPGGLRHVINWEPHVVPCLEGETKNFVGAVGNES